MSKTRRVMSRLAFAAGLTAAIAACSPEPENVARATVAEEDIPAFGYDVYTDLLQTYVDDQGMVDYAGLKANRHDLDAFIASMGGIQPSEYETWDEAQQLALWMNAYNAITLQYIIDHYPIEGGGFISGALYPKNSIRQIPGVWKELTTNVMGRELTLDAIEHDIIRDEFSEPRIHVAIVCAAMGCPPLRREAYVGERVDEQLADQSRRFLSNPARFSVERANNTVTLSAILKWFGEDFVPVYGQDEPVPGLNKTESAVVRYASEYVSEADSDFLLEGGFDIAYSDYDWSLNEQ